jgi:hypothetical protein
MAAVRYIVCSNTLNVRGEPRAHEPNGDAASWSLCSLFLFLKRSGLGDKPVEVGTAIEPTVGYNSSDPLRVGNVGERVRVEQDEIGELASFDRTE